MAKRLTKADVILSEARERMVAAQNKLTEAQESMRVADAVYQAQVMSYYALERSLTPKQRKKTDKPAPTAQKDLPVDKPILCGVCGNAEDYQDHFKPSPNYHEFEAPKVKKAAK